MGATAGEVWLIDPVEFRNAISWLRNRAEAHRHLLGEVHNRTAYTNWHGAGAIWFGGHLEATLGAVTALDDAYQAAAELLEQQLAQQIDASRAGAGGGAQ